MNDETIKPQDITQDELETFAQTGELPPKRQHYFSLFSGQIYTLPEDDAVDAYQIPIIGPLPKYKNCNKCFGRLYTDYNLTSKHYTICRKCLKKLLDVDRLEKNAKKSRV